MSETPHWNLPLLTAGQAQKEISHNEALLWLDRLLHLTVVSRALGHPPEANSFIIGTSPSVASQ